MGGVWEGSSCQRGSLGEALEVKALPGEVDPEALHSEGERQEEALGYTGDRGQAAAGGLRQDRHSDL